LPARISTSCAGYLLDRVALDACADRLADDRQQIDEALRAQQRVEGPGARDVPARKPLERRRFVVVEVVDVRVRIAGKDFTDAVECRFEGRLLLAIVEGPPGAVAVRTPQPEQVFASAVAREPGAFEVEEQIAL
jgi:hypothetical protein